mmetsp:Transcript_14355/g.30145  ORF Transcript_14355/g.30145 Transcript_14355/m.30145 type:complete len:110 (-) Transcript_14355:56-385(-)
MEFLSWVFEKEIRSVENESNLLVWQLVISVGVLMEKSSEVILILIGFTGPEKAFAALFGNDITISTIAIQTEGKNDPILRGAMACGPRDMRIIIAFASLLAVKNPFAFQ